MGREMESKGFLTVFYGKWYSPPLVALRALRWLGFWYKAEGDSFYCGHWQWPPPNHRATWPRTHYGFWKYTFLGATGMWAGEQLDKLHAAVRKRRQS